MAAGVQVCGRLGLYGRIPLPTYPLPHHLRLLPILHISPLIAQCRSQHGQDGFQQVGATKTIIP